MRCSPARSPPRNAVVLHKGGCRDNLRSFVIREGVSFYIPGEAGRATVRTLASLSAPSHSIVPDFMTKTYGDGDAKNPRTTPPGFPQWPDSI